MENKFLKENLIAKWLDNRLNDDEKNDLEASGELDDLKIVLDEIDTWEVKKFDVDAGLEALKQRQKTTLSPSRSKPSQTRRWLSIAASVLILVTGGYFSWNYFNNQPTTVETMVAESKTILLPSGSEVKLDALSNISYNKNDWENNRTIHLSGQAFFNVTKGNSFKVITDAGTVTVLGTQFNVNSTKEAFKVECYEGKVKVVYSDDDTILTKGKLTYAQGNSLILSTHTDNTPDWMLGYSRFDEAFLPEIISDLEKYYDVNITLPKKYEHLQFTGKITHLNLDAALQALFNPMEINYNLDANNRVTFQ